jgi:hypothetical protein
MSSSMTTNAMVVSFQAWAGSACPRLSYLDQLSTAGVFASEVLSSGSVESMIKEEETLSKMSSGRAKNLKEAFNNQSHLMSKVLQLQSRPTPSWKTFLDHLSTLTRAFLLVQAEAGKRDSTTLGDVQHYFRYHKGHDRFRDLLLGKNVRRNKRVLNREEVSHIGDRVVHQGDSEEEYVVEEHDEEEYVLEEPHQADAEEEEEYVVEHHEEEDSLPPLKAYPHEKSIAGNWKTSPKKSIPVKSQSRSKRPQSSPIKSQSRSKKLKSAPAQSQSRSKRPKSSLIMCPPSLLDRSILYTGKVRHWICAEQMDPQRKDKKLRGGPAFLPEEGIGVLKMHMWQQQTEACVFLRDAHVSHHGQLDSSQQQHLVQDCQKHSVSAEFLYNHQSHTDGAFVKVLNGGTHQYLEFFEEIAVNPTEVVLQLLVMEKNSDQLLSKKTARNTISIDLGYGNQSYEHPSLPHRKDNVLARPVFIHDKAGAEVFYQNAGCLMDKMTHGLMKYCSPSDGCAKAMSNDQRFLAYASKFNDKTNPCGVHSSSRFEAITWGLTKLGTLKDMKQDTDGLQCTAQYPLGRHTDGPNDSRPGYNYTAIWSIIIHLQKGDVVQEDSVYRLSLIAYTRTSVGICNDKEQSYCQETQAKLKEVFFVKSWERSRYKDLCLKAKDMEVLGKKGKKPWGRQHLTTRPAFLNKNGFLSSYASLIIYLRDNLDLSYDKQLELLYIALMSNSQTLFWEIISGWIPESFAGSLNDVSLLDKFRKDAIRNGGSPSGGPFPRCNPFANKWPSQQEASTPLSELKKLVQAANTETIHGNNILQDKHSLGILTNLMEAMPNIGEFSCLSFFPLCTMLGFIQGEQKQRAFYTYISCRKTHFNHLKGLGCNTRAQRISLLSGLSLRMGLSEPEVENGLCEVYRTKQATDVFFENETIYNIVRDKKDDRTSVIVLQKVFGQSKWEPQGSPRKEKRRLSQRQKPVQRKPDSRGNPEVMGS